MKEEMQQIDGAANKKQFIFFCIISSLICITNSFCYENKLVIYFLTVFQVCILSYELICGRLTHYFCYYVVFMSLALEFPAFVGTKTYYGLLTIKIGSINVGVLLILPLLFRLLIERKIHICRERKLFSFLTILFLLTTLSFISFLIHYMLNDNGMNSILFPNAILTGLYQPLFVLVLFLCLFLLSSKHDFLISYLENTLFSIIVAISVTMILSLLFSNYGSYGGLLTLQVPNIYMVLPCSLMILFYKNVDSYIRVLVFICGLILLILTLFFNANGKAVLSIGLMALFLLAFLLKRNKGAFFIVVIILPLILFLLYSIIQRMSRGSLLLEIKVEQAIKMVSFFKSGQLDSIPESPRMRIAEFLNIIEEYKIKPWDLVFGKGFLGNIQDHLGVFREADLSTFQQFELDNHVYYNMHESLNYFFLSGGLLGLYFLFKGLFFLVKAIPKTFWGIIGFFWFLLFFNYSITISVFGVSTVFIALLKLDEE